MSISHGQLKALLIVLQGVQQKCYFFVPPCTKLYEFETLLFVGWYPGLEEHRVCSVLSVEERHVSVDPGEQVHALV